LPDGTRPRPAAYRRHCPDAHHGGALPHPGTARPPAHLARGTGLWPAHRLGTLLTGWERFTPAAAWFSTAIMLIAMTNDFWLPLFGVKGGGMSGQAALGSFVGGVIGTFAIPIPLIGSLISARSSAR